MPNIKSAKKRVLVEKRNALRNKSARSEIKTVIKKFEAALAEDKKDEAAKIYKDVTSILDTYVLKGIVHKNQAARKKSNLAKRLNKMA
ncbi:MAG: 30S ribosomal protein S20 [Eubacteriales bacterium]